ncbi:MAG: hypothetical protein M0Z95_19525 [Actinomycetota bacterium]|nr:hypothetical protein [Actinomycetota bacterium]
MAHTLTLAQKVDDLVAELSRRDQRKHRKVVKCLALLEQDPSYPSLNSHPYQTFKGPNGEPVYESYVEQHTPGAWRVWWFYGPANGEITVVDLGPHP